MKKGLSEKWIYLEGLRKSGIVNMYGAAPYLSEAFGLSEKEAKEELTNWMKNYDPKDYIEVWYFTFGCGQEHAGKYVKIYGDYGEARRKMFDLFGNKWAFQYSEDSFNEYMEKWHPTELEVIE